MARGCRLALGGTRRVPARGGIARRITDTRRTGPLPPRPAVSPDGRRVAFTDGRGCESDRCRLGDGGPATELRRLAGNRSETVDYAQPVLAARRKRLAFRRGRDLAIANRDGFNLRVLVRRGILSLVNNPCGLNGRLDRFYVLRFGPRDAVRRALRRYGLAQAPHDGGCGVARRVVADASKVTPLTP